MDSKLLCYAKSPIPIFNSNSPPNYVIMPALLAHVDHTTPKTSPSSPVTTFISQFAATNKFNNFKVHVPTCSKEIIYKSKRTRNLMMSESNVSDLNTKHNESSFENNTDNSLLNTSSLLQSPCSLPPSSPPTSVFKTNNQKTNNRFINNLLIKNLVKSKSPKLKTMSFNNYSDVLLSSSSSNDNSDVCFISSPSSRLSNEVNSDYSDSNKIGQISPKPTPSISTNSISSSFMSDSFLNSALSEQSQENYELNNRTLINFENCNSVLNETPCLNDFVEEMQFNKKNENQSKETINKDEYLLTNDTYTITYPSEWQFKVNRMINCYVLLKKIDSVTVISSEKETTRGTESQFNEVFSKNQLKLKCGVCSFEFNNFNDLIEHKEQNLSCKNDVNFLDHSEQHSFQTKKSKRKKKDFSLLLSNHRHKAWSLSDFMRKNNKKIDNKSLKNVNNSYYRDEDLEDLEDTDLTHPIFERDSKNTKDKYLKVSNIEFNKNQFFSENETNNTVDSSTINEIEESYLNLDNDNYMFKPTDREQKNDEEDQSEMSYSKPRRSYTRKQSESTNNLTCEKCNKGCRTKAELLVHMHKHAGKEPFCWICQKKCASFSNLISHIQLHTGEKPFTCQFCGKQFTQDAHLTRHIRLHTGERPFICSLCGKTYKDYSYYKTHLRIHRGERLYKCNYCDKEYYDASYYKKHTRLHTGEKPYMCTVCGKQFHRSDYLKLHSYSHTSERPFTCNYCGKGFKMNYNLKLHLKSHDVSVSLIGEEKEEDNIANNNLSMMTYNNECMDQNSYNFNFVNSTDKNISDHNNNLINLNLNHPKINSITSIANASLSNDLHDIIKMFDCA